MRRLWKWILHSGMLEGAIAVGFLLSTMVYFQVDVAVPLLIAGGCGTWLLYLADRTLSAPEDAFAHPRRARWIAKRKVPLYALGVGLAIVSVVQVPDLPKQVQWLLLPLLALAAAYLLPVFPRGRLKQYPVGSAICVAATWAAAGVGLPLLYAGASIGVAAGALLMYRFGFVLANVLLCDWLDRAGDRRAGLRTIGGWLDQQAVFRMARLTLIAAVGLGGGGILLGTALQEEVSVWLWAEFPAALGLLGWMGRGVDIHQKTFRTGLDAWLLWPLLIGILWLAARAALLIP